ncbi:MAG: hypothetical protein KDI69_00700 [Xanthomonadales bacterium]|nr:hypothetical protein [Xanthomonadales bacterium]
MNLMKPNVAPARVLVLSGLGLMLAACATPPAHVDQAPVPDYNGQARYELIPEPAGSARYQLEPGQSVELPELQRNQDAIYPTKLVALNLDAVTLMARLSVDTEGRVSATWISEYDGDENHRPAFEQAVREAAAEWQFRPMVIYDDTQANDQGEAKPFSVWFKFQFDVVDGKPQTSSGQTPSQ